MEAEFLKAIPNLLIALITLGLAWLIGNRLSVRWNLVQKSRETDIANVQEFYSLYGEFKEVSKIWRVFKRNKDSGLVVPSETRWSLAVPLADGDDDLRGFVIEDIDGYGLFFGHPRA